MIKLNQFLSLSEAETNFGKFSINWTKSFETPKLPLRKQGCLDCDNEKTCSNFAIKPQMNCFKSEVERACKSCLDLLS